MFTNYFKSFGPVFNLSILTLLLYFAGLLSASSGLNAQSIQVNSITTTPVCAGSDVTITFTTTNGNGGPNRFTTSTVYTIYLSDGSGANFTSQGTFSTPGVTYAGGNGGVTSGITHVFAIPGGSADGAGYIISLGSSSPTFNGSAGAGGSAPFTINGTPTTANAGADQTGVSTCGLTQVTLGANTPTTGTGAWSIVSGVGGSINNNADPATTFDGNAGETYTLQWTVSNGTCNASTDDVVVTFNTNSVAPSNAISNINNVCPGTAVDVSASGGVPAPDATYQWYTGSCGGTPEGSGSPLTVNPAVTTTYYVRLEGLCNITACASVTVTVDPGALPGKPGGMHGDYIVCDGATALQYYVNPANNAVSYSWTIPAGMTQTGGGNTNIITVDLDNPFTVADLCVVSENICGVQSAPRCQTITNVAQYTPGRIVGSLNVCPNTNGYVYYTNKVDGAISYNWILPAGMTISSGAGTRVITVNTGPSVTPGPICLTVDNSCGTSLSYCKNITVSTSLMPGGITGPKGVCANQTGLTYSVSPVSGAQSYTWSVPAGFTINNGQGTNSISVDIGAVPSTGDVCVTANFTCGASIPRCVTVSVDGVKPGTLAGLKNICKGQTGISYSVPVEIGALSYNWTFPSGMTQTGGGSSNSVLVDADSTFTGGQVCVTITSDCGISAPRCIDVYEYSTSVPGGITGPNVLCQNTTGNNFSVSPASGASSYVWYVPPGITIASGQGTTAISVDVDNTFTVGDIGVQAISACGTGSQIRKNSYISTINPGYPGKISASASFCPGTTVTVSVAAIPGASTYQWELPSGMTFTAGPPTNTNSISVDVSAGFNQGEICVRGISACGIEGYMRCQTFSSIITQPGSITGPAGVCPSSAGVEYSVKAVAGASSYNWALPAGWSVTNGAGTNVIEVSVPASFVQGQIRVSAVSTCGNESGVRILEVSYVSGTPGAISGPTAICDGNTYSYSIDPVNGADSYNWTLPTGVSFSAGPPSDAATIFVDVNGSYAGGDICVAASTACGMPGKEKCIAVGIIPDAPGAVSGPTAVCASQAGLVYSIDAMPGISNYNWTFTGDISIISGQGTNSVTVDIGGSFSTGQLCVEAINSCGTPGSNTCINLSLTPAPPSSISATSNFCAGSVGTLTCEEIPGADSYSWVLPAGLTEIYGNGTSSITVAIDPAFSSGNVCVTAYSSCGAPGAQYCQVITPNAPGTAEDIFVSTSVCPGQQVVFSVEHVEGAGSYTWVLPAGLTLVSGQGTPSILVSAGAGFTSGDVCVTANSACGVAGVQFCKNFSKTPSATGNITAPANLCVGGPDAVLSVPVLEGVASYNWTVPLNVTIVSGQGTNVLRVSANVGFTTGQFTVAPVTYCGNTGLAKAIILSSIPGLPGSLSAPTSICPGSTDLVFSVPVLKGATSYNWTLPAEFTVTSGANSNAITVDVAGGFVSGQVCVSAVSECGNNGTPRCKTYNAMPNQPGGVSGVKRGVCDQALNYSVATAQGADTYTWTAPAGASITNGQGTQSVEVTFTNTFTSGQLQVYTTNACGSSAPRLSPLLEGAPDNPGLIGGLTSVCNNQTGVTYTVGAVFGANTYTWSVPVGANIVSGQGTGSITVDWGTTAGNVSVIAGNDCGISGSSDLSVLITCRVSSSTVQFTEFSMFPNPTNDKFTLSLNSEINSRLTIELSDLAGRITDKFVRNINEGSNTMEFGIGNYPSGTYFVRITDTNGVNVVTRIVKQ